ncbi:sulfatase-like hydrolase/transferase [Ruania alba]|uniref:Arylsulfatase A n=1 Tax=Ruania alba TaxID=648782 RepID=A0A1H5M682_9MICO|nr:sulfatase-like hydrolase/transferase [Ruania alba]SEE84969.1 arylsulfatase A [Ruania alba]
MSRHRPNIVQIVADDMGIGDLSMFNYGASSTPAMDQLAADGTVATQHYSASPVCAPARAALLTGRYPQRTGVIDTMEARGTDRLGLNEITVGDVLQRSGYVTGLIGKWHNGAFDPRHHPNKRGFSEFSGFRGGWQDYWDWRMECDGTPRRSDGRYITDVLTDDALNFIRRHQNESFYLHLAYSAPHFPFQAPESEVRQFQDRGLDRRVATIYAMLAVMDRGIARLCQELDDLHLSDNTLVMVTSDNGPQLDGDNEESTVRYNVGFNGAKQSVLEGGIRVPLIVRWPDGIEREPITHEPIHFTDWMPTLAHVAEAALPEVHLDGCDVLPVLRGEGSSVPQARYWQWTRYRPIARCNAAVRDGQWKLVWPAWAGSLDAATADLEIDRLVKYDPDRALSLRRPPAPGRDEPMRARPQLFNLLVDPTERIDVAQEYPTRVDTMTGLLDHWFDEVEESRLRNSPTMTSDQQIT